jgi:cell wall assembly regulator SMI1
MTTREVIDNGLKESFKDAKGNACQLRLKPGLSQPQIEEFEERLTAPLPSEVRELLTYTSGFTLAPFGEVNFFAREMFGLEEILPLRVTIATDGSGNYWMVDVTKGTGEWGPVLSLCQFPNRRTHR